LYTNEYSALDKKTTTIGCKNATNVVVFYMFKSIELKLIVKKITN